VHIDASAIALSAIISQLGEGNLDHLVYFASKKISKAEHNYTTTEREGFTMVYALQKFRQYLSGSHFKFFTDHSVSKYLVNKPMLEGRICKWLLFQEFSFEVIVKPGKLNVVPDHLSKLESGESGGDADDQLLDAYIFRIEAISDYLSDIALFLTTGTMSEGYSATQKRHLVVRAADYQLIASQLYKLGLDNILRRCVLDHERPNILWECHNGVSGGHVGSKDIARKILQAGLWWPTLFKDVEEYAQAYDVCQRVGKPSLHDELPLHLVRALQSFEKWVVDFIGPINPPTKHSKARYIITTTDYLTRCVESKVIRDCSTTIAAQFIF
jgi:hypothetical protein